MTDATVIEALPESLREFIAEGKTLFRCEDGDWEVAIEYPAQAYVQKHLSPDSVIIANNGCGDFLFLTGAEAKEHGASSYGAKVFVYWHEGPEIETFTNNLSSLTSPPDPRPSAHGPVYYSDGATQVLIGDHVYARDLLLRHVARVVYVPGISKRNRELEHGGLAWVGFRFESGSITGVVIDPETSGLKKSVKFLSRATSEVEEIDPYEDFE